MSDDVEKSQQQEDEAEPRGLYERLRSNDEGWELWSQLGVLMLGLQLLAYGVAFASLGQASVIAHSSVISLLGLGTMPLMFWGLVRSLFQPPVWRWSRTVGFVCLLAVGVLGNTSYFSAPVSTGDWEPDQEYRLPFDGQWMTMAGGDDRSKNYHMTTMVYRWAYDFAPLVDGSRYEGSGEQLEDHHCYGMSVRAPVDGEVVQVLGGEPDQDPGDYHPNNVLGNHVAIKVADDVYLYMAHLKQHSLEVGSGDEVSAGDVVAKCGNSGRTETPHLHIHLQNGLEFPMSESLPLVFHDYVADGEVVEEGMPLGTENYGTDVGQIVENRVSWEEYLGDDEGAGEP